MISIALEIILFENQLMFKENKLMRNVFISFQNHSQISFYCAFIYY